ncbi:unnamed protein product [Effrenium voratum]|uniref:Uncharacterized protein n=1 Tax=Effrenium voratum TaxID=2562239 RepID=A0AA36HR66_9DINO|nr:unnamed protein product [Effrenium voratum]
MQQPDWSQEDCSAALAPQSIRHSISYSNLNGQEQVHESKVTCSGDNCETMSNDVLPQIIRVRPLEPKTSAPHRMCAGSPRLIWDGLDTLASRVVSSTRRLFGYTAAEPAADHAAQAHAAAPDLRFGRSEGIMKSYSYFNTNGHEEMKQVESHCKDGTCVQRSRTFSPQNLAPHANPPQPAPHHPAPQPAPHRARHFQPQEMPYEA